MTRVTKLLLASSGALLVTAPAYAVAAQGGGQGGAATQQPRANQNERRICRSEVETGSLARRRRRCYTQAEWDLIARAARENTQYEMDRSMTKPGGQ